MMLGTIVPKILSSIRKAQEATQFPVSAFGSVVTVSKRPCICALPRSVRVLNMPVDWAGYGYAALVASGGVIGYVKAGSVPSLAAGLLFGGLAGVGAYQMSENPKNVWVSLGTSGTLAAIMGKRFYNSRKFMPPGLMCVASVLMAAKIGYGMLEKPQES